MAQHGYLREGYGMWGDSDDRDEDERHWRDEDRERGWRGDDGGRWRDEQRWRGREDERGFMFGGDDRFRGDSHEWFGGRSREDLRRSPSSRPDDHYRSWRQKQIEALDRDYDDYCREREQQFHQDFDSWRSKRQGSGRAGAGSSEALELDSPTVPSGHAQGSPSPIADATLGTNNPENATTGRGRR